MKRRTKILLAVVAIPVMLGLVIGLFALQLSSNMKSIQSIPLDDMDVTMVEDGTYVGSYYYQDQIGATLEVTVFNHTIIDITIVEHVCGKGTIAEVILDDIIAAQNLDVDAISGATTSSHVLKLAVEDALKEDTQ